MGAASKAPVVITSAAYVTGELVAECGRLPPSFLPIGNRRLFVRQVEAMSPLASQLVLTLPRSFVVSEPDRRLLERLGVEVMRCADGIRLGDSLVRALHRCRLLSGPLIVLHGDTLLPEVEGQVLDSFSVAETSDYYVWAQYRTAPDGTVRIEDGLPSSESSREVLTGLFGFSDTSALLQCLSEHDYDFVRALDSYSERVGLRPKRMEPWLDFGHLQTYFRSRKRITTERSFNRIAVDRHALNKGGKDPEKLRAEAHWFRSIPESMRVHLPQFLGESETADYSYSLEYLYTMPLSDSFVFGRLPAYVWSHVFERCGEFLNTCRDHSPPDSFELDVGDLYREKTLRRLSDFFRRRGKDSDRDLRVNGRAVPSVRRLAEILADYVAPPGRCDLGVMHGDFCLSNIFFDFRSDRILAIDPRGYVGGRPSVFGDRRYDLAKLHHSVIGLYDFIVADYFDIEWDGDSLDLRIHCPRELGTIQDVFSEMNLGGYDTVDEEICAVSAMLFLSMLPLHSESIKRQDAFLANAYRLFEVIDR
jgi:hypothetical protein